MAITVTAQMPGALDPNFGTNGIVVTPVGTGNDQVFALAVQPDGKIVTAGNSYANSTEQENFLLMRYLSNGTPDPNFGTNGQVTTDFGATDDAGRAVAIQPDGNIVVVGYTLGTSGGFNFAVARYLANGAPDPGFGTNGKRTVDFGSTDFCLAMTLQPDGKIVLAGRSYNGATSDFALVRLLPNGTLDNSFGTDGKVRVDLFNENESINAIALYANGSIAAAGETSTANSGAFAVAKFTPTGALDNSFGDAGKIRTPIGTLADAAYAVAIQTDGKMVVAGQSNSATISDLAVVRYLPNGTPDNSFSGDGIVLDNISPLGDYGYAVHVQTDGKIIVAGSSSGNQEDVALFRYGSDGLPDPNFGTNGRVITDAGASQQDRALALTVRNGKLIVAGQTGNFGNYDVLLAQYEQGTVSSVASVLPDAPTVTVYPNPARSQATLALTLPQPDAFLVRMYNAQGQCIGQWETGPLPTGHHRVPLRWPEGTAPGLYRVVVGQRVLGVMVVE
jgi:uncharacterized delta-60 repeat protein